MSVDLSESRDRGVLGIKKQLPRRGKWNVFADMLDI